MGKCSVTVSIRRRSAAFAALPLFNVPLIPLSQVIRLLSAFISRFAQRQQQAGIELGIDIEQLLRVLHALHGQQLQRL